jgi:hypothetical protein
MTVVQIVEKVFLIEHIGLKTLFKKNTDNYRTFSSNNYRDIEGETGAITDVFRVQNNLYIQNFMLTSDSSREKLRGIYYLSRYR